MDVDVSVTIVNYNARDLLQDCLESVAAEAAASGISCEVVVADNASADDSVAWLRERHPDVRVVETGRNGGFAAGHNAALLVARGRLFLLLNSDARLRPGSLAAMVAAVDAAPDVGMVGPRVVNPDGSLQRSIRGFPTLWRLATEFLYLRRLAPGSRLCNAFYGAGHSHERDGDVEWVMGACMLVPRRAVDDVGLMNEAYFMFSEETEWQWRLHRAGWRVRFCAGAAVEHLGGGTTRRNWGLMYRTQVCNHVRVRTMMGGERAGRRARRLISIALALRVALYRLAALVPVGDRAGRRARAGGFADARRAVRALDVASLTADVRPAWPGGGHDAAAAGRQDAARPR